MPPDPQTVQSAISASQEPVLGVKLASLVAGFAGGVVSLSYVATLSRLQAFLAVITGALCAAYLTPMVTHYLGLTSPMENGVAFAVGLTAMNIVPGLLRLSEIFKNDPGSIFKRGGDSK